MYITLSGQLGSGKSTLCRELKKHGYEVFSTGEIHRRLAAEQGLSTLEFNKQLTKDDAVDLMIDNAVKKHAAENAGKRIVFDSRMAWHFVPQSLKVFLLVSPSEAANRVFGSRQTVVESYQSKEAALAELIARREVENERFMKFYGKDCNDYRNYDLIIDTTEVTVQQLTTEVLQAAQLNSEGKPYAKYRVNPRNVLFAKNQSNEGSPDEAPILARVGNSLYVLKGRAAVTTASERGDPLVTAAHIYDENEVLPCGKTPRELV